MSVANVKSAEADMTAHTVTVEYDDAQVKIDDIVKALGDAGFVASPKPAQ
jgi:copper chaperone CopZ